MAASALLRLGPAHDRYCAMASDVFVPRASEIAASQAASALGSTEGVGFDVVVDAVDPEPEEVDPPAAVPLVAPDDAGSGLALPDVVDESEATTTAVGVVAEGSVRTSPSPLLPPRNAKMTPMMPSTVSTAMPATMGIMLLEGLPAA